MHKRDMSRRHLLGLLGKSGVGANFLPLFLNSILSGVSRKALAQSSAAENHIVFQWPGAPYRANMDLFLTPYGTENFIANPAVGTCYSDQNGRYTGVSYETVALQGINAPYVWSIPVPAPGGGEVDPSYLLQNTLAIQGINAVNSAHAGAMELHFTPIGTTRSMTALSADLSSASIPSIDLGSSNYRFLSLEGKSPVFLTEGGNLLEQLSRAFTANIPATYLQSKAALKTSIDKSLDAIMKHSVSGNPQAQAIADSKATAADLIMSGFEGIGAIWDNLLAKYTDLVQRAIDTNGIQKFNNLPIGTNGNRNGAYNYRGNARIEGMNDLRNIYDGQSIPNMAANFALTEYVIGTQLSNSVSMSFDPPTGTVSFDAHRHGIMPTMAINFTYFRAFLACMCELKKQLVAKNLWESTLVDSSGEFNRSVRAELSGSDHGWAGKSVNLYSGKFTSPLVIGNIIDNGENGPSGGEAERPGTWGDGAPVAELNRQLGNNDLIATVAHLLNAPNPITSANSLVNYDRVNKTLTPLIEKTRIVQS